MKLNQKGFTALEIVLLLVIVGIVGGVIGYVVNNINNDQNETISESSTDKSDSNQIATVSKAIEKSDKELIAAALIKECESPENNPNSKQTINQGLKDKIAKQVAGSELTRIDKGYAYVSTSCSEEPGGGFAAYLKKSDDWKLILKTQDNPECSIVDGAPVSVVPKCYDQALQDLRAPRS